MSEHPVTNYDLIAVCTECHGQVKILNGGNVAVHLPISERTVQIQPCNCPPPTVGDVGRDAYWYCAVHRIGSNAKGPTVHGEGVMR